jgi:hypothetical protein
MATFVGIDLGTTNSVVAHLLVETPVMRLTSAGLNWRFVLTPLLILADLVALWIWAVRPPRVYSDWLGIPGEPWDAPIVRLFAWASEESAPRTPSGFFSLFEAGELFVGGALLFALILLIVPIAMRIWRGRLGLRLSSPVRIPRAVSVRFRVTTALIAIAIVGLYLGWEINAWRTWRLRSDYLLRASVAGREEDVNRSWLRSREIEVIALEKNRFPATESSSPGEGYYRSKAAFAAARTRTTARYREEISYHSAMIEALAARRRKYERAAANPWAAVAPDPPSPELAPRPELVVFDVRQKDYARLLAANEELARTHPDFVEAHEACAWIMATCPDARYRNGKLAVASATRACELTNWKDFMALTYLAAAFAEVGDFAEAVKWQQEALAMINDKHNTRVGLERLKLFKSGQPYRFK